MSKFKEFPRPSRRAAFLVGAILVTLGTAPSAFAMQVGGGSSGHGQNKNGTNTNYVSPTANRVTHQNLQNGGASVGYGPNAQGKPFQVTACGAGDYQLNRAGVANRQIANGGGACPKPGRAPGTIHQPPFPPPLRYVMTVGFGSWWFNGCQSNPARADVMNASSAQLGQYMKVAPGESSGTVGIAPPTEDAVQLGGDPGPLLHAGQEVPSSGQPRASATLWMNLQQDELVGTLIPGPMWAIVSRRAQKYVVTPYWAWEGHWVILYRYQKDGPPIWTATESYNVESCPAPMVDFSPTNN